MKIKFAACLICFLMIGVFTAGFSGAASEAGYNPISVSMELDKAEFTEPEDVTVAIRVSNVGDDRIPGPVYLFYPDGKSVTEFGDGGAAQLDLGGFTTWKGTWRVTQRQLETGRITFTVKYPIANEDGNIDYKSKLFSKVIIWKDAITPTPFPAVTPTPMPMQYVGYALASRQEAVRIEAGNSDKSILTTLPAKTLVSVLGQVYQGSEPWSLVETQDGITGYVPDNALRHITPDEARFYIDQYNTDKSLLTPAPSPAPALPYTFDISGGKAIITKYTGTDSDVAVPAELNGFPVAFIGEKAFDGCDTVNRITLPESVTYIGDYAFYNCAKLAYVCLPKSVTSIGYGTFFGCGKLQSITLDPLNPIYSDIGGVLFDNAEKMLLTYPAGKQNSRYSIPKGTAAIAKAAFMDCSNLQGIFLPESVTEIGAAAFSGCYSLTEINLPAGLTSIRSNTFWGCTKLRTILIPEKVTAIENNAFGLCMSLYGVMIPDSVTNISNNAFPDGYGFPKWWLILYGSYGSYAQAYARENGIAFADAKVYSSLFGLDAFKTSSGAIKPASADDPFAIFDSVPGAGPNTSKAGEFGYFTDLVMDSLWPAAGSARAAEDTELSPVQTYRERVLNSGGELSTTVSVQPGEGLGKDIENLLRSLQLRLHEKRQEDLTAYALELVADGTVPMYFSGAAGFDAAYLSGSLLEEDVLTVRREEIRDGLLTIIQSFLSFLDEAAGSQARYMAGFFRPLISEGSGFTEALSGGGGQTDEFLNRLMDRAIKVEETIQSELHDAASSSAYLHFTGDDIRDFLLLPQPFMWMRVLSQQWDTVPGYTPLAGILQQSDFAFKRSLIQYLQAIKGGDITISFGMAGEVAAVEGFIDFDLAAIPGSYVNTARLTFSFYKKTGPEGARCTVSGKLNIVYNEESAARFNADNCDLIYLDGMWDDTGKSSGQGTLRLRTQEPNHLGYVLDTGLQYKRAVSGTEENGMEEHRINFYINSGEDMEKASLVSTAMVDQDGIEKNISLYLSDLQKPVITVGLSTQAIENSGLMDDVIAPDSSRLINPIYWSVDAMQMYIAGHKDAFDKAVSMLSYWLPPDVTRFLGGS